MFLYGWDARLARETERDFNSSARNFMTNAKPEAGENEPFVRIYSCMCLVSMNSRT